MNSSLSADPYERLFQIQQRCHAHALPLPQKAEVRDDWLGIGFRLGPLHLVAPLEEVSEILTEPGLAKVPGAKTWVRGIANVRGNLLPIMDLSGYLHGAAVVPTRRSRVMVVNYKGVFSGLMVDEVLGLKHFDPRERTADLPTNNDPIDRYLVSGFRTSEQHWGVFSMFRLAQTPRFLQVAI